MTRFARLILPADGRRDRLQVRALPSVRQREPPDPDAEVGAGVLCGLASVTRVPVEEDPRSGRLVTNAGLSYATASTVALTARVSTTIISRTISVIGPPVRARTLPPSSLWWPGT
jgi:hypothetical protein